MLPFQEIAQVVDHLAVAGLFDRADAGPAAQLDVVIQAGARILAGDLAVAGQVGEDAAQHIQGLVHRPDAGVGAEVARAVLDHLAGDGHLGEGVRPVHLDVGVALVVLEADVVARAVLLDQVHLEDERLELRTDHDPLDIGDVLHQLAGLVVLVGALLEIGAHPVAQVDRLADVDDLPAVLFIDVTARLGGQGIEVLLERFLEFPSLRDCITRGGFTSPIAQPSARGSLPPQSTPVSGSRRMTCPRPKRARFMPLTGLTGCPISASAEHVLTGMPSSRTHCGYPSPRRCRSAAGRARTADRGRYPASG